MLTPLFRLDQTDRLLKVVIHAPMAKLHDLEVCVEDGWFHFASAPYFLKFQLPGPVFSEEDTFDFELKDGDVVVILQKTTDEYYSDLNLITKLLHQNKAISATQRPLIQEVGSSSQVFPKSDAPRTLNWFSVTEFNPIDLASESHRDPLPVLLVLPRYGFAGSKSNLFQNESELSHVVDLPCPDRVPEKQRYVMRVTDELKKFSAEHYLADYFEPESWTFARDTRLPWNTGSTDDSPHFTDDESHRLITLGSRVLPPLSADEMDEVSLYLGLADILLAYIYDFRVREGEEMTESGWNIVKLSATLSWFEVFHSLPDLLVTFYRRAIVFPLVRSWSLCSLIRKDLADLLVMKHAKSWCLKCLLEVRRLLISYPGHHVFADLYLNDYIVWIQTHASTQNLHSLGVELQNYKLNKSMLQLDLPEVERLGKRCLDEEKLADTIRSLDLETKPFSS